MKITDMYYEGRSESL